MTGGRGRRALPLLLLVVSSLFAQIRASDPVIASASFRCFQFFRSFWVRFVRLSVGFGSWLQLFHETFDEIFEGNWVVSGKEEYAGNLSSRPRAVLVWFDL